LLNQLIPTHCTKEDRMQYEPKKIADELSKLRDESFSVQTAIDKVSNKYNIRREDTEIIAMLVFDNYFHSFGPNKRRPKDADTTSI
jgi:hypothetical protein